MKLDYLAVWARAKVNLVHEVLGRRADGYHEVRTVLHAIDLADVLEFQLADHLSLSCYPLGGPGAQAPEGPENLVYRAATLLRQVTGSTRGARMTLYKGIPAGSGLGGGSSDAAVTLLALNEMWELGLRVDELAQMAAQLGSDVPFFLTGGAAWGEGRGERCVPLPRLPDCLVVVACPPASVSTAAAYQAWDTAASPPRAGEKASEMVRALQAGDLESVARCLGNDLRPLAERMVPAVTEAIYLLRAEGALGAEMSGSGPAVFGLFPSLAAACRAKSALRRHGNAVYICRPVGPWRWSGGGE